MEVGDAIADQLWRSNGECIAKVLNGVKRGAGDAKGQGREFCPEHLMDIVAIRVAEENDVVLADLVEALADT